ncbi:MAG: hypothetical protein VZT48_01255 [Bulleidia sp.]|nr:hypothetical protein [Bulleidia sp.]
MKCLLCGRNVEASGSLRDLLFTDDQLCSRCRGAWIRKNQYFLVDHVKASSSWIYNDAFSDALIQFKECGDEILKDVFLLPVKEHLHHRYRGYTLLLMPSTQEKTEERGFSHLREMFECLDLPMMEPFIKETSAVQKQLSRRQRQAMQHEIILKPGIKLPKKIVLADDVMTTGSTIRGALNCINIKEHDVRIYVCAKVPEKNQEKEERIC